MINRPRRLRQNQSILDLTAENSLSVNDFIYPIFVKEGNGIKEEIGAMPGIHRFSVDRLHEELDDVVQLGIKAILLFGLTEHKNSHGTYSYDMEGPVQSAIRLIKSKYPSLIIFTDVCICAYTDHGHCGVIKHNEIDNDESLEILQKMALSHAKAGAHFVAPSAMMDGQIGALRQILDKNNYQNIGIMAYSAKYYSSCYGPFREAAGSAPQFGNRSTYQMNISNSKEAIKEILLDIEEGADMVMVKPGIFYLDIIKEVSQLVTVPIAAYNVSGEYSMVKAAAEKGWINYESIILEMAMSFKRAGCKLNITYFAKDLARLINQKKLI